MNWIAGVPHAMSAKRETCPEDPLRKTARLRRVAGETPAIPRMITLSSFHLADLFAHARETDPAECCGLIGGTDKGQTKSIYPLRNVATHSQVSYEVAPEELFAAQREMRQRGEQLLAIYHSHPRSADPTPSEIDVRQAYYPSATYLIIGLGGPAPVMRGFKISEVARNWERVEYAVADE